MWNVLVNFLSCELSVPSRHCCALCQCKVCCKTSGFSFFLAQSFQVNEDGHLDVLLNVDDHKSASHIELLTFLKSTSISFLGSFRQSLSLISRSCFLTGSLFGYGTWNDALISRRSHDDCVEEVTYQEQHSQQRAHVGMVV